MIQDPVPPEAWEAEGARVAGSLEDVAAAVVIGGEPEAALLVAMAIARAQPDGRRVAIGDLVGGLEGLEARPNEPGLLECFRDGVAVSSIGWAISDDPPIFALPSGHGPVAERWLMESARWTRLVAGFREVDALLLLIAPAHAPGLASLIDAVDGVVAVDLPPVLTRAWPLIATVDRPEAELPMIGTPAQGLTALSEAASGGRKRTQSRRIGAALGALAIALLAAWFAFGDAGRARGAAGGSNLLAAGDSSLSGDSRPSAGQTAAATPPIPTDTITLPPVVNPEAEPIAANFAVELVAANTLSGANSGLVMRGQELPAPTLAPVQIGSDGRPWFRALTGAWHERDAAQDWLDALRDRGLLRQDVGRVLRVPYALLLASGIRSSDVPAALARWHALGIPAYALVQDDGSARVFAGAFETSGQAALLAKSLRDLGTAPVVAFRTGRTF